MSATTDLGEGPITQMRRAEERCAALLNELQSAHAFLHAVALHYAKEEWAADRPWRHLLVNLRVTPFESLSTEEVDNIEMRWLIERRQESKAVTHLARLDERLRKIGAEPAAPEKEETP